MKKRALPRDLRFVRDVYPEGGFPKSMCECGHTGDGPHSVHLDVAVAHGHGSCAVPGCSCVKFRWERWLTMQDLAIPENRREAAANR